MKLINLTQEELRNYYDRLVILEYRFKELEKKLGLGDEK
jgi:hypothetical protein